LALLACGTIREDLSAFSVIDLRRRVKLLFSLGMSCFLFPSFDIFSWDSFMRPHFEVLELSTAQAAAPRYTTLKDWMLI